MLLMEHLIAVINTVWITIIDPVHFFWNAVRSGSGSELQNPVGSQSGNRSCSTRVFTASLAFARDQLFFCQRVINAVFRLLATSRFSSPCFRPTCILLCVRAWLQLPLCAVESNAKGTAINFAESLSKSPICYLVSQAAASLSGGSSHCGSAWIRFSDLMLAAPDTWKVVLCLWPGFGKRVLRQAPDQKNFDVRTSYHPFSTLIATWGREMWVRLVKVGCYNGSRFQKGGKLLL